MTRDAEIDSCLEAWATGRKLQFQSYSHWDAVATRVLLVDSGSDVYEFYAGPVLPNQLPNHSTDMGLANVGVVLVKRGSKRHHAFYRERLQFSRAEIVPINQMARALDSCFSVVEGWVHAAGHILLEEVAADD